jgi:hypothetical protein
MNQAQETRPSPIFDRRTPRFNSPRRNTRLRWIAPCAVTALALSSCERMSVNEQGKLACKDSPQTTDSHAAPVAEIVADSAAMS